MSAKHARALRAVRDDPQAPNCRDANLTRAAEAGLIRFTGWPAGHWRLTDAGRAALATLDTAPRQETAP
jgi:hypothetical protein